jgi:hypothetical protein
MGRVIFHFHCSLDFKIKKVSSSQEERFESILKCEYGKKWAFYKYKKLFGESSRCQADFNERILIYVSLIKPSWMNLVFACKIDLIFLNW